MNGVVITSEQDEAAHSLLDYLLAAEAQQYFADETFEYPLAGEVAIHPDLPPLAEIEAPEIDLTDLRDLQGTLDLLDETGALE